MTAVAATTGPDILSAEFDADPYPFTPKTVAGVRVPDATEHPDPLYLWQLIKDYSGRAFPAAVE